MSTLEVWILIMLIVGVIASNLAVLKYSAKFKLPQFGQHDKKARSDNSQHPPTGEQETVDIQARDTDVNTTSNDTSADKAPK